jgi:hypothetical protein
MLIQDAKCKTQNITLLFATITSILYCTHLCKKINRHSFLIQAWDRIFYKSGYFYIFIQNIFLYTCIINQSITLIVNLWKYITNTSTKKNELYCRVNVIVIHICTKQHSFVFVKYSLLLFRETLLQKGYN